MTPARTYARINAAYQRIYGHLTDAELEDFYRRGFIPVAVYEYLRAVRGL